MTINQFQGEYRFLSNFWPLPGGKTNEHAFQAAKTLDSDEWAYVYHSETPGIAKRRGREVTLREDWDEIKDDLMLSLIRIKFSTPELATSLLATGDEELIEGNTWGDTYWGVDLATGEGQNKLGKILMQVRDDIRSGNMPDLNRETED